MPLLVSKLNFKVRLFSLNISLSMIEFSSIFSSYHFYLFNFMGFKFSKSLSNLLIWAYGFSETISLFYNDRDKVTYTFLVHTHGHNGGTIVICFVVPFHLRSNAIAIFEMLLQASRFVMFYMCRRKLLHWSLITLIGINWRLL